MTPSRPSSEQLAALADHLAANRESILRAWRNAVDRDPELATASTITRAQFNDHIPEVLDGFERQLRATHSAERARAQADEQKGAAGHGLHRWQQGYDQRETMGEWGRLHLCLLDEIERYGAAHPELDAAVMRTARRALVQLCNAGVCESTDRYAQMQRAEAATRVRDLERALEALQMLERERAETWREAAHDLRGSVSVISNASMVLSRENVPDPTRAQVSRILHKGVASLHHFLTDLMSLARLEAGHERRHLEAFDAAQGLRDFCDTLRPLATERNLFLKTEGPESLAVEGDWPKVQRIVQNLVLNALNATERGGVRVSWAEAGTPTRQQWAVCVHDTGPGLEPRNVEPLSSALKEATTEAHEMGECSHPSPDHSPQRDAAAILGGRAGSQPAIHSTPGEGIGLSIVKRLCELLDATLELESAVGEGTTFRVVFPRRWDIA